MNRTRSSSTITIAIIGTILFVLVLSVGTVLTGFLAKKDTEQAVESVSLLYLDELAGRREQVVSANLSKKIDDMNVAREHHLRHLLYLGFFNRYFQFPLSLM